MSLGDGPPSGRGPPPAVPISSARRAALASLHAICIKEEPVDEQPEEEAQEDSGWNLSISDCHGHADDVWTLQSEVDWGDEVKQEAVDDGAEEHPVVDAEGRWSPVQHAEHLDDATRESLSDEAVRVKQERLSDEEEETRAHLFYGRFDSYDDSDEQVQGEEGAEEEEARGPRTSTTLHPADVKPPTSPPPKPAAPAASNDWKVQWKQTMKHHYHKKALTCEAVVLIPREEQEAARLAGLRQRARRPSAPPMPPRRAHQRAISFDRTHALQQEHREQAGLAAAFKRRPSDEGSPTSPSKKQRHADDRDRKRPHPGQQHAASATTSKVHKTEAASPSPPRRRESTASSSSESSDCGAVDRKRRVAHTPKAWYHADDQKVGPPSLPDTPPQPSSPPSPSSRDPRLNKPRPDADLPHAGAPCAALPPASPPRSPARKRGLLPTPPKEMALLPIPPRKEEQAAVAPPRPAQTRDPRLLKHLDAKPAEPAEPVEPAKLPCKPESLYSKPMPKCKKKILPVLPAATHTNLSPLYEGRSPLFVADEPPRKGYSSEAPESKLGARAPRQEDWIEKPLYIICSWQPAWLKESRKISQNKLPALFPNNTDFSKEKRNIYFSSPDEYTSYFVESLLLELWEGLKREFSRRDNRYVKSKSQSQCFAAVENHTDLQLVGNKIRRTYDCHCGSNEKFPYKRGDLVIIRSLAGAKDAKEYFAYVNVIQKKRVLLSNTQTLCADLKEHFVKEPDFKCFFQLMMCGDKFPEVPKILHITNVKNIDDEFSMFKTLHEFLNHNLAPIIFQPSYTPRAEPTFKLKTDCCLGGEQKLVAMSLIQDVLHYESPSISVVEGGPGTGKTYLAAALARELVGVKQVVKGRKTRDCFVILCAKTNAQLNSLYQKLCEQKKGSKDSDDSRIVFLGNKQSQDDDIKLKKISVLKLAENHILSQDVKTLRQQKVTLLRSIKSIENQINKGKYDKDDPNLGNLKSQLAVTVNEKILVEEKLENRGPNSEVSDAKNQILMKGDILLTTSSGNGHWEDAQKALRALPRKRHVLIVDDASELTEPTIIKLIVTFDVSDVVLFGDVKQHNPYVLSKFARNAGLVRSLMERFAKAFEGEDLAPPVKSLTCQHRLHPEILKGLNELFYSGRMKPCKKRGFNFKPYMWFNCTYMSEGSGRYVEEEKFISKVLRGILRYANLFENVTQMKRQVKVMSYCNNITNRLQKSDIKEFCDPKEIIGLECQIMILSVGSSNSLWRNRFIRTLSRARKCLLICGKFSENPPDFLVPLLKDAKSRGVLEDITDEEMPIEKIIERIKIQP